MTQEVEEATDAYVEHIRELLNAATSSAMISAAEDADAQLTAVYAKHGLDAAPIVAIARRSISHINGVIGLGAIQVNDMVRRGALALLDEVYSAVDALAAPKSSNGIEAAESKLATLQAQYQQALADLQEAMQERNLDRVVALKARVDVELPAAVEDAQLEVADLQVASTQAATKRPTERAAACAAKHVTAIERLDRAREELQAAGEAAERAAKLRGAADLSVGEAHRRVTDAQSARDALAHQIDADRNRRFRRMAGLPDDDQPRDAPEIATPFNVAPIGRHPVTLSEPSEFVVDLGELRADPAASTLQADAQTEAARAGRRLA